MLYWSLVCILFFYLFIFFFSFVFLFKLLKIFSAVDFCKCLTKKIFLLFFFTSNIRQRNRETEKISQFYVNTHDLVCLPVRKTICYAGKFSVFKVNYKKFYLLLLLLLSLLLFNKILRNYSRSVIYLSLSLRSERLLA